MITMILAKFLRTPFFTEHSTLLTASASEQCKSMKKYTESLCCRE